jgi:hypothetical protein
VLEPILVELAVEDLESISVASVDPLRSEDLAQGADVSLNCVARQRRGRCAPECVDGLVDGYELARVKQQKREPPAASGVTA